MIRGVITCALALIMGGCVQHEKVSLEKKSIIIDVRTAGEFDNGHLDNALNIPYTIIEDKIGGVTKDLEAEIVLYCRSGRRSGIAQNRLLEMGYKNAVNAGGYEELKASGR